MRWVIGFAHFWYDFIVGDSVVLALGGVLALVVGWTLVRVDQPAVAELVLPLMLVITLALSVRPARSHRFTSRTLPAGASVANSACRYARRRNEHA